METKTIIPQILAISTLLSVLSGFRAIADDLCNTERFTPLFLLSQNIVTENVSDFKFEILQKQNDIANLSNKLRENDFSVTFSQDVKSSNSSEISGFGKPAKNTSISLGHPLNFFQRNTKTQLIKEQIKLEKLQLYQLRLKRQIAKLKMIAELSQANKSKLLYLEKQRLIDDQLRYYSAWRDAGKPDFEKELATQSEASTNRDKILANSILIKDLKQKMSIDEQSSNLVSIGDIQLSVLPADNCILENFQVLSLGLEKRVLEIELKSLEFDKNFELKFESTISSQVDRRGNNSSQAQASIVFSKNLYDGKLSKNERAKLISNINLKNKQIRDLVLSSKNDMILRRSREEVLTTSLKSIKAEIMGINERIDELQQRQNLGQTVFLELTSNKKEKIRLQESALRITTDFITGWYDFLSNKRPDDVRQIN